MSIDLRTRLDGAEGPVTAGPFISQEPGYLGD